MKIFVLGGVVTEPLPYSRKFLFPANSSQSNGYVNESEWLLKETFLNATRMGSESLVFSLLEIGADPNTEDITGN